jgi:sulfoxide reductase heme-binding subunit YedZ
MRREKGEGQKGISWLRVTVHLLGWLPLALIAFDALTGRLSVNPIQDVEQRLGRAALYFLLASLAVTPLTTLTGWRALPPRRRALGLYAFLYAALHFATFVAVDYGFDLPEILRLVGEKPFILLGFTAGILLLPLAVTSFDFFMRKMGKRWKLLHRLVYVIAPIVIVHYGWAKKGTFFALSGDILQPLLWGLLVLLLLFLRIPAIRRPLSTLRQRLSSLKSV